MRVRIESPDSKVWWSCCPPGSWHAFYEYDPVMGPWCESYIGCGATEEEALAQMWAAYLKMQPEGQAQ